MRFREIAIPEKDEKFIEAIAAIQEMPDLKKATLYLLQIGIKKYCADTSFMYDYNTGKHKPGND